jgi:hypothetical protein
MQLATSKEKQNCFIPLQTNNPNRINQHKHCHLSPVITTPVSPPLKISPTPQKAPLYFYTQEELIKEQEK